MHSACFEDLTLKFLLKSLKRACFEDLTASLIGKALFEKIAARKLVAEELAALAEQCVSVFRLPRAFPCAGVADEDPALPVREEFHEGCGS